MKKNRKLKNTFSNQEENSNVRRAKKDPKNVRRVLNQKLKSVYDFDSDEFSALIYDDELDN